MKKIISIALAMMLCIVASYADNTANCKVRDGGYAEVTFYPPQSASEGEQGEFIIANSSSLPLLSIQVKIEAKLNNRNNYTVIFDRNATLNPPVSPYQSYVYKFNLPQYTKIEDIKITVGGPVCSH
ncbi:MAG: hypothetical protein IJE18_09190 [Bacteroidaceae bacterium]|nr:hypothetical protein [Bacteroidaceae bacterium]